MNQRCVTTGLRAWGVFLLLALGYLFTTINIGTSLDGTVFLCRPLGDVGLLTRGTVVKVTPSPGHRASIHAAAPAADLQLPWLKRVQGIAGDTVCWTETDVRLNDRVLVTLPLLDRYPLHPPRGCQQLQPGEVVVLGDEPKSVDSRYLGPMTRAEIPQVCWGVF